MLDSNRIKVNANVSVTLKQNATIKNTEVCPQTKFEISTSNNMRYVQDTNILELRPEVKVKITVTLKWYAPLCNPEFHPHSKFGNPTFNNIGDIPQVCWEHSDT